MVVVYLDELVSEEAVIAMLPDLENEVIEAVCATRNKARMITAASSQVKQVIKKCVVRRWKGAQKELERMFKALESAAMELDKNLWTF
jgi:hypothetical protein